VTMTEYWLQQMEGSVSGKASERPNLAHFTQLLHACARSRPPDPEAAARAFRRLVAAGLKPDDVSLGALALALGADGLHKATQLCKELGVSGAKTRVQRAVRTRDATSPRAKAAAKPGLRPATQSKVPVAEKTTRLALTRWQGRPCQMMVIARSSLQLGSLRSVARSPTTTTERGRLASLCQSISFWSQCNKLQPMRANKAPRGLEQLPPSATGLLL
ncbi:unnamed protein product, partial [Polarella glacialis]